MRLPNTETFEAGVFYDEAVPPYAIVSHRWRAAEVSYQDFLAHRKRDGAGFWKITKACELVASDGRRKNHAFGPWIWIDSYCLSCILDRRFRLHLPLVLQDISGQWYIDTA